MKPTDFAKHISDFLSKYLPNERGASFNTISSYSNSFVLLLSYIEKKTKFSIEKLTINDITKDIIIGFLDWIQEERKCSDSTRNLRLSAIHSFYKYLKYQNIQNLYETQKILSINKKKFLKKGFDYISLEGIQEILKQPNLTTERGIRDLALISLMYDTGARVQEIIDLTPSMVNLNKPYTIKLIGKGNKARIIPIIEGQMIHLNRYLKIYRLDNPEKRLHPLFFNSRKEKFTRSGVTYILKKYVQKARNKNTSLIPESVSCHSLRHSKAMHLFQAGVNLIYIRDLLGHSSIQTTEIYARADGKHKRMALEKAYVKIDSNEKAEWINNKSLISWLKKF